MPKRRLSVARRKRVIQAPQHFISFLVTHIISLAQYDRYSSLQLIHCCKCLARISKTIWPSLNDMTYIDPFMSQCLRVPHWSFELLGGIRIKPVVLIAVLRVSDTSFVRCTMQFNLNFHAFDIEPFMFVEFGQPTKFISDFSIDRELAHASMNLSVDQLQNRFVEIFDEVRTEITSH